jgi:hypothetical protein
MLAVNGQIGGGQSCCTDPLSLCLPFFSSMAAGSGSVLTHAVSESIYAVISILHGLWCGCVCSIGDVLDLFCQSQLMRGCG